MGDPKRRRKKYTTPGHPYEEVRLKDELILIGQFGLRNKKELWKAKTLLGSFRGQARSILALEENEKLLREKILTNRLNNLGILSEGSNAEDILSLGIEDILNRRLQTVVYKKGLSISLHHARQLIVHRHVKCLGRVVNVPSYNVKKGVEETIELTSDSPLANPNHVLHPKIVENATEDTQEVEIDASS